MCENQPEPRSCTTCPKYDGMKCTAADMLMGDREQVLQEEHRRGFICVDTGEVELKGDGVLEWTAEQERLRQEKGYKSCEEMWDAEGKQVKCGFRIDEDNEELEPVLQVSNGPGPIKLTFQYEENAKSVDDTMYHPNQPENQQWYTVEARANIGVDLDLLREHNPNIKVIRASELEAGSPSSECPSLREGPPQKGKIDQNMVQYTANRLAAMRDPDGTCNKCSHCKDGYCHQWHMHIHMPHIPCGYWSRGRNKADWCLATQDIESPLSTQVDNASLPPGKIIAGSGLTYVKNPPPLFTRDSSGYWEPIKPRSCTNCKLYNDPICMKIGTHIGNREEMWAREKRDGFQCIAALPKEEREAVITSIGCNKKETR